MNNPRDEIGDYITCDTVLRGVVDGAMGRKYT
jgi:hypothetical protein